MAKIASARPKLKEENLRQQDGCGFKSDFMQIHLEKLTLEFFSLKQNIEGPILEQGLRTDRV